MGSPKGHNPREHGGMKHDAAKPRPALLDPGFTLEEARVAAYGASKYEEENWRKFNSPEPFLEAANRHLLAVMSGDMVNDEDGGVYHLAQVAWNARAAWWIIEKKLKGRWKPKWTDFIE